MRRIHNYLILLCFISIFITPARAAEGIEPFRPHSTLSLRADLCPAFLNEWTRIFDSSVPLLEDHFQAANLYPTSLKMSFPPESSHGFYGQAYSFSIDFDGDGDLEVLHIDSRDLGWRYLGVDIFLVESEEAYSKLQTSTDKQPNGRLDLNFSDQDNYGPSVRLLYSLRPLNKLQIVIVGNEIFTLSMDATPTENHSQQASLIKLNAPKQPAPMCTVELLPAKSKFAAFRESSTLFQNLADVYGGPQGCQGTMGWTAPPLDALLPTIFHRPQILAPDYTKPQASQRQQLTKGDSLREVRFLTWAASDPQSWEDYTNLKRGRASFIEQLSHYYRAHFTQYDSTAAFMAEAAWRALLDTVVYARNPDEYTLTQVAWRNNANLPLSPDTPPQEVARIAVEAWLEASENPSGWLGMDRDIIWTEALLTAVLARLPMETIRTLVDRRDAVIQRQIASFGPNQKKVLGNLLQRREAQMDALLAAALGDVQLMDYFMQKGANPNASTTWFHKTPLMYAVQQNELASAEFLLEHGADVNAATDGTSESCYTLHRDQRTALMYAAENADAELIDLLLNSGADISAADTRGNLALWYFEHNRLVEEPLERNRVNARLTP